MIEFHFSPIEGTSSPQCDRRSGRVLLEDVVQIKPRDDFSPNPQIPSDHVMVHRLQGSDYLKSIRPDASLIISKFAEESLRYEFEWYRAIHEFQHLRLLPSDLVPSYVALGKVLQDGVWISTGMLMSDVGKSSIGRINFYAAGADSKFLAGQNLLELFGILHQQQIVHGDVSAKNVSVDNQLNIGLIDPAKDRGTPPFIHPGFRSGEDRTTETEIYSLGIMTLALANITSEMNIQDNLRALQNATNRSQNLPSASQLRELGLLRLLNNSHSLAQESERLLSGSPQIDDWMQLLNDFWKSSRSNI